MEKTKEILQKEIENTIVDEVFTNSIGMDGIYNFIDNHIKPIVTICEEEEQLANIIACHKKDWQKVKTQENQDEELDFIIDSTVIEIIDNINM